MSSTLRLKAVLMDSLLCMLVLAELGQIHSCHGDHQFLCRLWSLFQGRQVEGCTANSAMKSSPGMNIIVQLVNTSCSKAMSAVLQVLNQMGSLQKVMEISWECLPKFYEWKGCDENIPLNWRLIIPKLCVSFLPTWLIAPGIYRMTANTHTRLFLKLINLLMLQAQRKNTKIIKRTK